MAKTGTLPGIQDATDEDLSKFAEKYVEKRDERMNLLRQEIELKEQVIAVMRRLRLKTYRDDEMDLTITLESKTTVKVKIGGSDDDE
jgi:hypothetical protein